MRRVLIISPRFPPKNNPDHHRVRTSLPYYRQFGWDPTVLCLTPETTDGIDDPALLESVDPGIRVVRVPAWSESVCRKFGFGHIDYRCLAPIYRAGNRLLSSERFDLIFFSTTVFSTFILARPWKRKFGCKVVFDFQDPWSKSPSGFAYDASNAPGGLLKYRISEALSRRTERFALRAADHVISVSESYVRDLSAKYPWLKQEQFSVIPFGASPRDYEMQKRAGIRHNIFAKDGHFLRWVYAGRGGPDLNPVVEVFFQQLARWKELRPDNAARLRVHFVGTNYSPAHRTFKVIEPLARRHGLEDIVVEHCERIPYFEVLSLMAESSAVLLIGSVSADYTASKLFNCVLSKRPVLAMFHERSLVSKIALKFSNVFLATFQKSVDETAFAEQVRAGFDWLTESGRNPFEISSALIPYSAEQLTEQQCRNFDRLFKE
jgi:hypothetical protein